MTRPDVRPGYLIGRADRLIRSAFEEVLADAGMTLPEYTVMSVLASRPGLSNARLARRALVTPQAMHKVIRALEVRGFVSRSTSGGRVLAAELTPAGQAAMRSMDAGVHDAEQRVLAPLSPAERTQLVTLLGRISGVGR